jgi:hypothetical protein
MNTKSIEDALKEHALALEGGSPGQKAFGKQLIAIAVAMEKDRHASVGQFTNASVMPPPKSGPRQFKSDRPTFFPRQK